MRTGLTALKARVKVRGLHAIDRRTAAAQSLLNWQAELLADLGGDATVTAAQRALVVTAARTKLYLDHVDGWLMERQSLIIANRRSIYPVVTQRQELVNSLARLLVLLGLERRTPKSVDLATYLARRPTAEDASSSTSSTPSEESSANAEEEPEELAGRSDVPPGASDKC
jgi:hypothetical protein